MKYWNVMRGFLGIELVEVSYTEKLVAQPMLAAVCAFGLAIDAMHQLKCIHPPGGATAFAAVMGGSAIQSLGYRFVFTPVLLNAVVMVLLAILINSAFKWRRYPASLNRSAPSSKPLSFIQAPEPTHVEILAAIRSIDSFIDVSEEDLLRLTLLLSRNLRAAN